MIASAASRALVPGASNVAPPQWWRKLSVSKQGPDDMACGLHALTTAAWHLGTLPRAVGAMRLVKMLDPLVASRIRAQLPADGLFEKDLRLLAKAAGLSVYRPNSHDVAQFRGAGWLWMAFVTVMFKDPHGHTPDTADGHYVLVLDHLSNEDALILADPHPWNPPVYCVATRAFDAAWRAAKKGAPWAAALHRLRRVT